MVRMKFDTSPLTDILSDQDLIDHIANQYGTPSYVYSGDRLEDNVRRMSEAMKKHLPKQQLYYAIKANPNTALVRLMKQTNPNMGIDCSTVGELKMAVNAGFDASHLVYTGNYESFEDLRYALEVGLPINFDDISSYERCRTLGLPEIVSFRVNPGEGKGMYPGITTAGKGVKFGIPLERIQDAYNMAIADGVKRFGLHTMVGSGILEDEYFAWNCNRIMEIATELEKDMDIRFEYIDMGGGLGIPYKEDEPSLNVDKIFRQVGEVVRKFYEPADMPVIAYEPGRYLVADTSFILARVTGTKNGEHYYVGLDAGMNTLIRPALYGAYHRIIPLGNAAERETRLTDLTGQICENTDRIARDREFPELQVGDLIAILDTGAYGFSLASQYNGHPLPAEVLVEGTETHLIRRRETQEDLNRNVVIPDYLKD